MKPFDCCPEGSKKSNVTRSLEICTCISSTVDIELRDEDEVTVKHDMRREKKEQKKEAPRTGDGVRSLASTEAKDPDRGNNVSPVIIVLSLLSLLLVAVFVSIFSKRFYKAWSHGAHGKQLFRESFSVN